jgi:hypothetical protein
MSNPGPNIVNPSIQRSQAIVSVAVGTSTFSTSAPEVTYTVNGLAVGDFVSVSAAAGFGSSTLGIVNARVSAANTLAVTYAGTNSSTIPADVYLVNVIRSYPVVTDFGVTKFNNYGVLAGSNP